MLSLKSMRSYYTKKTNILRISKRNYKKKKNDKRPGYLIFEDYYQRPEEWKQR